MIIKSFPKPGLFNVFIYIKNISNLTTPETIEEIKQKWNNIN